MDSPSNTLSFSTTSTTFRRRRSSSDSANSPEFEFSNLGANDQQITLHSADELFSDGFLLPLHLLHPHRSPPDLEPDSGPSQPDSEPSALITSSSSSNPILSASKRWREIFKRSDKKPDNISEDKPEKLEKKKERKNGNICSSSNNNNNSHGSSSAELNINIWPFSRSRSAGNNSSRSKPGPQSTRKVSSAPCSRSNSSGESKSRKSWPTSPGRTGVHLGRSSPVWQVKKPGPTNRTSNNNGGKNRVLKLNVPVCIGYRQNMSCGSDESGGANGGGLLRSGGSGSHGHMFGFRGLFSKKSNVLTV